ncbi:MAG: septal ring lytic transglycosylase RlpA family protein [bacterium]|nr:septal ring lytic transglycosylase RlpA family protein [bacterium]
MVRRVLPVAVLLLLAGCATNRFEPPKPRDTTRGIASWYGEQFHGKPTASGEIYDMHGMTAAHRELPLGTVADVRNLENGRKVRVTINDRGPFVRGRVIDLSYGAAKELGMADVGLAKVEIRIVSVGGGTSGPIRTRRYTVQVGAYRERSNAVAVQRQLEESHPDVTVISEGGWHRVRVGTYRKRELAEDVRRQVARAGLDAMVVALPG